MTGLESPPKMADDGFHRRAHRHSRHIYYLLALGLIVLGVWAFARIAVCWGRYSWLGMISCHSQWFTFLALISGGGVLFLLIRDLIHLHRDEVASKSFRRTRSAWRGYRSLEPSASRRVTLASVGLIIFRLAFAYLVLASPVRF